MLKKIARLSKWHLLWVLPLLMSLFLGIRFFTIFIKWQNQKEVILEKLSSYKLQLDYLRNPLPSEEKAGEISVGTVAIPSIIFDRNAKVIGEFYAEKRTLIPIEKIPQYAIDALISSEDRQFYEHEGINYGAVFRAFIVNILSLKISQGGSTLTQQLAKVLFTDQKRTLDRKIFEFFCAREIEQHYIKQEILEMYLNLIYLSHGNYGIEASTQYFFGKSSADLSLGESAMLIGILPNPNSYSPIKHLDKALKRQKIVLSSMQKMEYISEQQRKTALKQFYKKWKVNKGLKTLSSLIGNFPGSEYRINLAPFFLDHIRQKLLKHFTQNVIMRGGLRIYTTLDYKKQINARQALDVSISRQNRYYDKKIKAYKKKGKTKLVKQLEEARVNTNGAFITIDPKTGYILTMIGGNEFSSRNQFNRATMARRQIGSVMKPLLYYLAIAQKIVTPATMVKDTKLKIGKHKYRNYDNKYLGNISLRTALKKSRNTVAVRVLRMTGIDEFRRHLSDLLDIPYSSLIKRVPRELGIALGTPLFTPVEVAQMYATLLNHGYRVIPRDLLRVENNEGKTLWEEDGHPPEVSILDPIASYITISMMESIFEKGGSAGWVSSLREKNKDYLPFQMAGKTGTTSKYKDAWFVGMTSDEVSVIWVGNDQNQSLGQGRSGGSLCSPVWVHYIRNSRRGDIPQDFSIDWPLEGISRETFCDDSGSVPRSEGLCPNAVKDQVFFEGTEPRNFCPLHLQPVEEIIPEL